MIVSFSLSIYSPTIASVEDWDLFYMYKHTYAWLTYSEMYIIKYNCKINNIDIDTILALIQSESNGNPKATSSANAKSLMQIMDCHWPHAPKELYDIGLNIKIGTSYYAWCLDYTHGNKIEALRVYNSGPFSNKYTYKGYENYCNKIIRNSNATKNLQIKPVEVN